MADGERDLREIKLCHWLQEVALPFHQHKELAALTVLEDKIQFVVSLESIAQLDNERMLDAF